MSTDSFVEIEIPITRLVEFLPAKAKYKTTKIFVSDSQTVSFQVFRRDEFRTISKMKSDHFYFRKDGERVVVDANDHERSLLYKDGQFFDTDLYFPNIHLDGKSSKVDEFLDLLAKTYKEENELSHLFGHQSKTDFDRRGHVKIVDDHIHYSPIDLVHYSKGSDGYVVIDDNLCKKIESPVFHLEFHDGIAEVSVKDLHKIPALDRRLNRVFSLNSFDEMSSVIEDFFKKPLSNEIRSKYFSFIDDASMCSYEHRGDFIFWSDSFPFVEKIRLLMNIHHLDCPDDVLKTFRSMMKAKANIPLSPLDDSSSPAAFVAFYQSVKKFIEAVDSHSEYEKSLSIIERTGDEDIPKKESSVVFGYPISGSDVGVYARIQKIRAEYSGVIKEYEDSIDHLEKKVSFGRPL